MYLARTRIKILVIINIWYFNFMTDIWTQNIRDIKINENSENVKKKTLKSYIRIKNGHFKVIIIIIFKMIYIIFHI